MANNLIPEELNALIQEYLTDGVLTDKERQVILNKAEKMGLDRDEIDLYLDAQVQKIDQATDAAARRQKGKTCPYCGGSIPLLTEKCPHCGEHITVEANKELQEIFDNLEEALISLKAGKDIMVNKATVERFARKAKMYYGSNPKVQKLLEEVENETIKAEKRAVSESRKNLAGRILSNKWVLYILFILLVPVLTFFLGSHYSDKEAEMRAEYETVKNELNEKYKDHNEWKYEDRWISLDSLKKYRPEGFAEYENKLDSIDKEEYRYGGKRANFQLISLFSTLIAVIVGIILLRFSKRKDKSIE